MKSNTILVTLVAVTVAMQAAILYKQYISDGSPTRGRPPAVKDAPKNSGIELAGLPVIGNADASVVLVEFSDYECPYCARHATGVGADVSKEFVSTGKIRQAFVNNPLPIHSNAKLFATAAICSGDQGQYWQMHDLLFQTKPKNLESIFPLAQTLGISTADFQKCLASGTSASKRIESDMGKAKELQLTGTPAFAIGHADSNNHVTFEKIVLGAQPIETFEKVIREVLSKS